MRLIDADALKYKTLAEVNGILTHVLTPEEINNAPTVLFPLTVMINDKVADEYIEVLKRLMEDYKPQIVNFELEKTQGKWMPVSEELPNLPDRYLVNTRYGEVMTDYFTGDHFLQGDDIIAWQPLPEPLRNPEQKKGGAE